MSGVNIFKNNTGSLPKSDDQIVRIDMDKSDIGGRKSHLPMQDKNSELSINHVPNSSSMPGK